MVAPFPIAVAGAFRRRLGVQLAGVCALTLGLLAAAPAPSPETRVPFELVNNHVYLDVSLDGKGPYHFAFDSGGSNLMDPAVARELGVRVRGRGRIGGVGNGSEPAGIATVGTLQMGDMKLRDERFTVARTRDSFGVAEGLRVDGLIGAQVLARFVTTFDYARREVRLAEPVASATPPPGTTLPVTFREGLPHVPCTVSGIAGECTVDTGSRLSLTVLQPFAAAHPAVVPSVLTGPGVDGYGLGGAAYGRLGRLDEIRFGELGIRDAIADFSTQQRGAFADRVTAANVGGGIWRRFTLTFDYPHKRLTLQPNAAFAEPDTYERSGLFLVTRDGAIAAAGVRDGTPAAEAGIATDDVIAAVEGRPLAASDLISLRETLSGAAGTSVRLLVLGARGGIPREVTVVLRDYV
ncbi:MAG: hypothetical protein NVSMB64_18430 [Candidatus Velthaea sp.]